MILGIMKGMLVAMDQRFGRSKYIDSSSAHGESMMGMPFIGPKFPTSRVALLLDLCVDDRKGLASKKTSCQLSAFARRRSSHEHRRAHFPRKGGSYALGCELFVPSSLLELLNFVLSRNTGAFAESFSRRGLNEEGLARLRADALGDLLAGLSTKKGWRAKRKGSKFARLLLEYLDLQKKEDFPSDCKYSVLRKIFARNAGRLHCARWRLFGFRSRSVLRFLQARFCWH